MTTVLDTSAVLALAFAEAGAEEVVRHMDDCAISAVNAAEIVAKMAERQTPADRQGLFWALVAEVGRDFTLEQARVCGELRTLTRSAGLSLGDRACIALAREMDALVLTADRAWADMDLGVSIKVIR